MIPLILAAASLLSWTDSVHATRRALEAQGGDPRVSLGVATAIHRYAALRQLPVDLVIGVIGVENPDLVPHARNRDGSLGVMQVQPFWLTHIKNCGTDLRSVETNVCIGTRVLSINLAEASTLRGALLRYNGCRGGPHCRQYPEHVISKMTRAATIRAALLRTTVDTARP